MQSKAKKNTIYSSFVNAFFLPFTIVLGYVYKSKNTKFKNFFALNVNIDKYEEQAQLVKELGCNDLMIRIPLSDINNLLKYKEFVESFKGKNITLNIIQDRENIEDKKLLRENITLIFSTFKGICNNYQIGNATNENKWGFFSISEYLEFFTIVQSIRNEKFQNNILIGSSVKGFDLKSTLRTMFNKFAMKFDKVSALLYVDKQGFPENPQKITFDLIKQINTIYAIATLAIKAKNDVIISEASWHIKEQKEANENAVSEEDYANYMVRYYMLALGTKKIQSVYWFQLVSSTFGLTYVKKGKLEKRKAFYAFKTMIDFLDNCKVEKYSDASGLHVLTCTNNKGKKLDIVWTQKEEPVELTDFKKVYDVFGEEMTKDIKITQSPIYAYH